MKKITSVATALCLATAFCGFCSGCASDIQNQSSVGITPATSAQADGASSEHKVILCPGYHAGFGTTANTISDGATKLSEQQEEDYWVDNAYYATVSAGQELPTPETTREETRFVGWTYAKDGIVVTVDKMPSELDDDLILYAKWFTEGQEAKPDSGEVGEDPDDDEDVGTDYVQIGDKKYALSRNTSASREEYWMGGKSVELKVDDTITLYMSGQKVSAFLESNSSGVDMSDTSSELSEFTVTLAGSFAIYLHRNSNDWSVQFVVTTPVTEITVDIPDNAAYSDVTFKNGKIRLYIKNNNKFVTSLSGYNLYMWEGNNEFFGAWTGKTLSAAMETTYNLTATSGLILIKSGMQTRDLSGFEVGNTYIITFGSGNAASMAKLKVE